MDMLKYLGPSLESTWSQPGIRLEPAWNQSGTGLEPAWSRPGTGLEPAWNRPGTGFFHLEPMFLDIGFKVWVPAELFLFKILKTGELSLAHLSPGPGRLPPISLIF